MIETTNKLDPVPLEIRRRPRFNAALLTSLVGYLTVWAFTRAHFMADTNVYAQAILDHQHGWDSPDYRSLTSNPFWDFGHILWRPLGWLCFVASKPVTQFFMRQSERGQVIVTLIGINFVAALGCVFLFFLLARRLIGNNWLAAFATLGLFSADAFLNYAHSGSPYDVGLACLVAGMYFSSAETHSVSLGFALGAGLMFGLAVLCWFPYVFVLPAAMASPLIRGYERHRVRSLGQTLAMCVAVGLIAYAAAAAILGIRSIPDFGAWALGSGHGQLQAGGLRAVARLAFSLPRSFINMGQDGIWFKRYLVHDPYAAVPAATLFRLSLWKLAIFCISAGIVFVELLRSQPGRLLLIWLAAAVVPIIFFALFIFEAGSIERYLPLYPFVYLALGYVLSRPQTHRLSKILLLVALGATFAMNTNAMSKSRLEVGKFQAKARIHDLVPLLKPNDVVMLVNEQDSLAVFRLDDPLDPINLDHNWQNYDMLEINVARLATWRGDFAARVLASWRQGGSVWLPERVFQAKPQPEWNWVEGDDKRVHWTDLPAFFSRFETGTMVDGQDGFVLLQASPKNKQILEVENHGAAE